MIKTVYSAHKVYQEAKKNNWSIEQFLDEMATIPLMLKDIATGKYKGYQKRTIAKLIAGGIYLISFIDFIPDFIPFLGWADDIAVAIWMYKTLQKEILKYRKTMATS